MSTQYTQQQIDLEVLGMTCDSCALHVTRALKGVAGGDRNPRAGLGFKPGHGDGRARRQRRDADGGRRCADILAVYPLTP